MKRNSYTSSLIFMLAKFLFLFLIPVLSILVSVLIDGLFHWTNISIKPLHLRILISVPLLFIGSYLVVSSNIHLYRTGKVYPWGDAREPDETKTLVTKGPYRYTRNPMILGYALILSSLGVLIDSITMTLITPSAFLTLSPSG